MLGVEAALAQWVGELVDATCGSLRCSCVGSDLWLHGLTRNGVPQRLLITVEHYDGAVTLCCRQGRGAFQRVSSVGPVALSDPGCLERLAAGLAAVVVKAGDWYAV